MPPLFDILVYYTLFSKTLCRKRLEIEQAYLLEIRFDLVLILPRQVPAESVDALRVIEIVYEICSIALVIFFAEICQASNLQRVPIVYLSVFHMRLA